MQWADSAIVLNARKHGENSAVVRLLAQQHGLFAGVVRASHSKANRGVLQPGNVVAAHWQARLPEHIGTLKCELLEANAAHLMQDAGRLCALTSACAVTLQSLPERHPYPRLYGLFQAFLTTLRSDGEWQQAYVKLELDLLAEAGFGLDLASCTATGQTDDLIYVSPKSGRAVSREAGEPYKDKLLPLPAFLLPKKSPSLTLPPTGGGGIPASPGRGEGNIEETLAGLGLTGYFLDHWLLEPHRRKLPAARSRLVETLKEKHGAEETVT